MKPRHTKSSLGSFIITIDTEGDNLWSSPKEVTTRNALYLPRFQQLCESFGLKPTYLVNYEMAVCPVFIEFGRDILSRKAGEIGMHLHAWNSPPIIPLTKDDSHNKPFLIEYPKEVVRAKIDFMTKLLEDTFSTSITSHRAGRWAINEHYAKTLIEFGYLTDCSVTPYINWNGTLGDPNGKGGSNYRSFPTIPYFIDPDNIRRSGNSPLLEVPMTVSKRCPPALRSLSTILRQIFRNQWLRPNGHNRDAMISHVFDSAVDDAPYLEFMLHSSELMPAGSPTFPDTESVEKLYGDLSDLFETASALFRPATLAEFRSQYN